MFHEFPRLHKAAGLDRSRLREDVQHCFRVAVRLAVLDRLMNVEPFPLAGAGAGGQHVGLATVGDFEGVGLVAVERDLTAV